MSGDLLSLIGGTPLVPIRRLWDGPNVKILAKLESANPGGSIKDRVALAMIEAAEQSGELSPEKIVLEATSGNTGIGLAMVCAVKGYHLKLLMPETASEERKRIMRAYGAEIELTEGRFGTDGAIEEAYRLAREQAETYVLMDQFNNPASIKAHYAGTGLEIWEQTGGKVSHVVATLGTSGTVMGITRRMREMDSGVRVLAVEPFAGHKIQGLKNMQESYPPGIFDRAALDAVVRVEDEEAFETARRLAREEGIFAGMSSGAAMAAALKTASALPEGEEALFVVILPDGGERYLSTPLFAAKAVKGVRLFDLAANQEKVLEPSDSALSLYTPGPSLDAWDDAEFFRRLVFLDVLARFTVWRGSQAKLAAGIADLDDRTLEAARESGEGRAAFARRAASDIAATAAKLRVMEGADYLPASESAEEAVSLAEKLLNKGLAYEKLRSVYYDVPRDREYGKVGGMDTEKLMAGKTVDLAAYVKDNPQDFTLFKRAKLLDIKEGEFLSTRWGNVRPSWFMQMASACSAGPGGADVFLGAWDQRFPHLDNLAAIWGRAGVRSPQAWAVAGECLVQEPTPEGCEDLAPGSRVAPGELIGRGFSPGVLRIWLLSTSYHKPLVFSGPTLSMWSRNRARVQNLAARLAAFAGPGDAREEVKEAVAVLKKAFRDSVEDDLALYKFWPALFAFCREITSRLDRGEISAGGARSCLKQLMVVDDVLRVLDRSALPVSRDDLPEEVRRLVEERSKAREAKDYVRADELRKELRGLGYRLEDGPRGALVYFCMG